MRYIRQEIFKEFGKEGQERLRNSTITIVGLGALGTVSSDLLARAGIGKLILIDRDIVDLSNLQRQSLFTEKDIGKPKALQAKLHLKKINSEININFFIEDLNFRNIFDVIKKGVGNVDLVLDCTDNLETRFLINDFCVKNKSPFIYASAVGSKGYIFNIIPEITACLRCFLKEACPLETCETLGVLNSITHLVSSLQVSEAIKILLNKNYEKKLLFIDVIKNNFLKVQVNKDSRCFCCSKNKFVYLDGKVSKSIVKLCGNNLYQVKTNSINKEQFNDLKKRLKKIGNVVDFGYCINFDRIMTIFRDGRALIKAKDESKAKSLYSKFVGH